MYERGSVVLAPTSQHNALPTTIGQCTFWTVQGRVTQSRKLSLVQRQTTPHETTIAMYAAAYKAESQAFTPWVVSRAFEQTGIFPFLPSKIFALANANASIVEHGKQKAYVTTMKRAAVSVLERSLPKQPVRVVCPRIQAGTLFLPFNAIAEDTKIKSKDRS